MNYGITLLQGIEEVAGSDMQINYARGCGITDLDKSGFEEAVEAAEKSDVVVLAIGGTSLIYSGIGWGDENLDKHNTCGEGMDRASLDPPGLQSELIRAIYATGKTGGFDNDSWSSLFDSLGERKYSSYC